MASNSKSMVRVALVQVVATGPYQSERAHGLVHVGVLPLVAGAVVQDWIINPEREFTGQFGDAIGFKNPVAKAAPTWPEQRATIQAVLQEFDAVLVLDRAGPPLPGGSGPGKAATGRQHSPEWDWVENVVLAGMSPRPVCVALDVLLAFFLPGYTLDDADDLRENLLLTNIALQAECGYQASKPQLPFVLHTMRRALRYVLAAVLKREPWRVVDGQAQDWLPVQALLQMAISQPGDRVQLRPFRLLARLAEQATCCDPAPDTLIGAQPLPVLPYPAALPGPEAPRADDFRRVLTDWLLQWRNAGEATPASLVPERFAGSRLDEADVTTAFAALAASVADVAKKSGDKTAAWQPRPAQQAYARFVTQAINENGVYALEAGTGTGKTFGYLVPALEYLRCHPNGLVVVATSTKNLQQQMLEGELPALLRPKGKINERYQGVRVAMLKGKNSYLCAEALAEAFSECLHPNAPWQQGLAWLYLALRLRDTKGETENVGQAVEMALTPPGSRWSALSTWRARTAADRACRHSDNGPRHPFAVCVYEAHRLRAEQAHLLVLNHHKLAVLPRRLLERQGRICIIDEADRFPDNYRNAIATELHAHDLVHEAFYKLLGRAHEPGGLFTELTDGQSMGELEELGLLGRAQERLRKAHQQLWVKAGFDTMGAPDNPADWTALEEWDEARLQDLLAVFALHQQVADAVAETPAAADAQTTAAAAFEAYEAVRLAQVPRRAAQRALLALGRQRRPAQRCLELLPLIGQEFMETSPRHLARLPFPVGRESHWQDQVRVDQPTGPPHYRTLYWALNNALRPLEAPLAAVAAELATLRDLVPVALQLHLATDTGEEPTDVKSPDLRLRRQLEQVAGQIGTAADTLTQLLATGRQVQHVPVVERLAGEERNPLGWRLSRAPYDLKPYLQGPVPTRTAQAVAERSFFDQFSVTIFTSATIYVENSTRYFRQQLNFSEPFKAELCLPPTFDYFKAEAEYVAGLLPHYLPAFNSSANRTEKENWRSEQLKTLLSLVVAFGGRTLVLFTSREEMEDAAAKLQPHLAKQDIELLVQQGTSQWQIRRFRRIEQSVMLGVERMWTGVDFAGPTLAQVIVWRLPMPSFSDPLVCHRKLHESKGSFWDDFYYPTTRLKLRQGFGRLVRRASDRGSFVMLDSRANQNFYHHLLSEVLISPFVNLAAAEDLHQHVADEVLKLIPGLKTDFADYRKLTPKKLGALVPEKF